jgi:hypothetical protein
MHSDGSAAHPLIVCMSREPSTSRIGEGWRIKIKITIKEYPFFPLTFVTLTVKAKYRLRLCRLKYPRND